MMRTVGAVIEGVMKWNRGIFGSGVFCRCLHSPSRRGGVDARSIKSCAATLFSADGREARARQREAIIVVSSAPIQSFAGLTTPSAPYKEASRHFY